MKRTNVLSLAALVSLCLITAQQARGANSETDIRKMLDDWSKAFRAKDVDAIMSFYVCGNDLKAFDIVPPLQVVGSDSYRKSYETFLAMYEGPIDFEFRDLRIVASDRIAFVHALERISGTMKGGQKSELWVRATSGLRKIKGKWLIVHDHISVCRHRSPRVPLPPESPIPRDPGGGSGAVLRLSGG